MSAILLILGWWIVFRYGFGDNSKLTGLQVLLRALLGVLCIASGCGVVAYQTWVLLAG